MDGDKDALVGLRFEVSGGLGRMSGVVVGKAAGLYLVQKEGAAHMELLQLDDLRSAKFYRDASLAGGSSQAPVDPQTMPLSAPSIELAEPPRMRLADQIRKKLGG